MAWITIIEWLARIVLVILIGLSFWSVTIMVDRKRFFKNLYLPVEDLKNDIRSREFSGLSTGDTLASQMFKEITKVKSPDQIDKVFDAFIIENRPALEKGLPVLGTLGSTTPFIGLLGTILGIIVSFGELSQGAGNTNSVMFSLAEALILTAVGLIVAIPAVIAFNYFSRKSRGVLNQIQSLKDLYLAFKD